MSALSSDLLARARHLACREPRRPKRASLMRSISGSYYALFHYLIDESTRIIVGGSNSRKELRQFAGRAFVHRHMRTVCREFTRTVPHNNLLRPIWPKLGVATNAQVQLLAFNFILLQRDRHEADYDLTAILTRQRALQTAEQTQDAMDAWSDLKRGNEELARLFAASLMLWPGLGGR